MHLSLLISLLATGPALAGDDDPKNADAADFPAAAAQAIQARWPGATYQEIERERKGFEVTIVTTDGQRFEVEVTAEGKIRGVEAAEDDED